MSTKCIDLPREASLRAPKGATHWRLIAFPAKEPQRSFAEMYDPDGVGVFHGHLTFEWSAFPPGAEVLAEWTELAKEDKPANMRETEDGRWVEAKPIPEPWGWKFRRQVERPFVWAMRLIQHASCPHCKLHDTEKGEWPTEGQEVWLWNGHDYFEERDWTFSRYRAEDGMPNHRYWKAAQPRPSWV